METRISHQSNSRGKSTLNISPTMLTRVSAWAVLVNAVVVAGVGWFGGVSWVTTLIAGWPAYTLITSVCFSLVSLSILAGLRLPWWVAIMPASLAVGIGFAALIPALFQQVLLPANPWLNLPSMATAVCFIIIGLAVVAAQLRWFLPAGLLAWFCLGLVVYRLIRLLLLGAGEAEASIFDTMAVHTAASFILLAVGGVLLNPALPFHPVILSRNRTGIYVRYGVLIALFIPVILSICLLVLMDADRPNIESHLAITMTFAGMLFALLVYQMLAELDRQFDRQYRYEIDLKQSNEDLQCFAFAASHDLQEPLRKIRIFSELLRSNAQVSADARNLDVLTRMEQSADKMMAQVEDALTYANLTRDRNRLVPVQLNDIVNATFADFSDVIKSIGADVQCSPMPAVCADPVLISRVFSNLIDNALTYRRDDVKPVIRVDAKTEAERLLISIQDNGPGLSESETEILFRPFARTNATPALPGAGMGLAICHKILLFHNSRLMVNSEPGRGTCFSFYLCLAPSD